MRTRPCCLIIYRKKARKQRASRKCQAAVAKEGAGAMGALSTFPGSVTGTV